MMILNPIRKFLHKDSGAATVETVLWFPLFIAVFGLMLDTAMIFHGQAKVLRVVQDGNREYSIGRIATRSATETYVEGVLAQIGIRGQATTTEIAGVAHTVVRVEASELQVLGYFAAFSNLQLSIAAEHMIENWEV